jgi:hypothetical protein
MVPAMVWQGAAKFPAWNASVCVLLVQGESLVRAEVLAAAPETRGTGFFNDLRGSVIIALSTPWARFIEETV